MAIIETIDLNQRFDGKEVLRNINLGLDIGEVFALIGPTGAGKTTLLRVLDLLDSPSSGKLFFNSIDVTDRKSDRLAVRRRMSYVQQRPLVFTMSVYDNIACGLKWRHLKTDSVRQKTLNALEMVGMADFRNRNARTLSGGETQRIAIARALVTEPDLLFLDEPTANMDPLSTAKIEEVLAHVIREKKTTIIMTTHDMSQGQRLSSRLGVMVNGELLQTGTVNDVFNSPQNREVAEFVGVENILEGIVEKNDSGYTRISVNGREITAISDFNAGEAVYVFIRPEIIVFSLSGEAGSARNVFKGKVSRINNVGPLIRIEVDCGFTLMGVITSQASHDLHIAIGQELYASFKATAIHVIKRYV